ncbi:flagellar type III secretion system pore protein FliP [Anaerosacchariphilus polymeriproducens]|uniref:Flagellar biosynthetic protein FliP n=1 Tax=Anaerosacchariphilus polymeriproducens TaxID=1812858 RepID=A0A371ASH7_9FIRM|nr:flagellar type III secretion system pore protein FliP [Anaerosacchariphilus polymeriproducens]RDU22420.1 flagellar biosynthetic protein FliP [Anaerosacchariphilus polymeriproducens]
MLRVKKQYRKISIVMSLFVFVLTLFLLNHRVVHATTTDNNTQQNTTQDNQNDIGQLNVGQGPEVATGINDGGFSINYNDGKGQMAGNIKILIFLTLIALAPSILIMLTSFTRIIIVLHFTRQALGTQTAPPNQVMVGLALFLTLFIMSPVFKNINENALKPFDAGKITQEQAIETGLKPLRDFMYKQTQVKDLNLFLDIANQEDAAVDKNGKIILEKIPISVLIPSFILSELRTAFIIGFLIYIPFIVIDMVVASTLMSMGMMMLPPTTISMPFKILLFVLADGWDLVIGNLVKTFY